jgi:hypothetical protein
MRAALTIEHDDDHHAGASGVICSLSFAPASIPRLGRALAKARRSVTGLVVEAVMIRLSEKGDPTWAADLEFDSESDMFCVRCRREGPLTLLLRRLEKRLADAAAMAAMRRLVKAAPRAMSEA